MFTNYTEIVFGMKSSPTQMWISPGGHDSDKISFWIKLFENFRYGKCWYLDEYYFNNYSIYCCILFIAYYLEF